MRYQLTLQFCGDTLSDYDVMVALEDELVRELGGSATVDGHDCGSGERNIFIITSDPADVFCRAKPALERARLLGSVTAAYRKLDGENYTVIWPENSQQEFGVV